MLTSKQERLILALLSAPDQKTAAEQAQVSEPSLYRWLRDPQFRRALDDARNNLRQASIAELARRRAEQVQSV